MVVYQDATSPLVRRVRIRDGAITTDATGDLVTDTFTGLSVLSTTAGRYHVVVGDGQVSADGNLIFSGTIVGANQFPGSDGSLWDVNSYNVNLSRKAEAPGCARRASSDSALKGAE